MKTAKDHYPKKEARKYLTFVFSFLDMVEERMMKELKPYIDGFDKNRIDATDPFEGLFLKLSEIILKVFDSLDLQVGIKENGSAVSLFNDKFYDDEIYQLIGFNDIPHFRKNTLLDMWTKKNVALIKGISNENIKRLNMILYDSVSDGTSIRDIYKQVKDVFEFNDARAKLIVDDQIGKLNANLDRLKSKEAEIDDFRWRDSGDSAVRPKHRKFNGNVYSWKNGAGGIFPGQEVRCRCWGEPVLDKAFGKGFLKEIGLEGEDEIADWLKEEHKKDYSRKKKKKVA